MGEFVRGMLLKVNLEKSKVLKFSLNREQKPLRRRKGPEELKEVSEFK